MLSQHYHVFNPSINYIYEYYKIHACIILIFHVSFAEGFNLKTHAGYISVKCERMRARDEGKNGKNTRCTGFCRLLSFEGLSEQKKEERGLKQLLQRRQSIEKSTCQIARLLTDKFSTTFCIHRPRCVFV